MRSVRPLRIVFLTLVLAALTLGQGGHPLDNPRVWRLGEQLACLCGCGSSVTSCNMLNCHFSEPARAKLLTMVNAGMTDSAIFDAFVKEYGLRILLKPPAQGFNVLGYVMPFIGILVGLAFVWWLMQRFRRPVPAPAGPQLDPDTLSRYEERIEKELEKLD